MKTTQSPSELTIIDVYDNVESNPAFQSGFGFACVIKLKEHTILFDTGGDAPTLLRNLKTAGLDPGSIDLVVLSHAHADHYGGLSGFLEENADVKVYLPAAFPSHIKKNIRATDAALVELEAPMKITQDVYSTGALGTSIKEQSLIIDTHKGLILITGCAHLGITEIIKTAEAQQNKKVYLAMGGFHHPALPAVKECRELGVQKVAPSHCTGEEAIRAFAEAYETDFIKSGVGHAIQIKAPGDLSPG